jgi:hypothetical protein
VPIHDWTKPLVGLFHHFHQRWAGELCDGLNGGVLPAGYYALVEQDTPRWEPDVLALKIGGGSGPPGDPLTGGGLAVSAAPPNVRHVARLDDAASYARKANRLGVRDPRGELVAVVEIVSPGNKNSKVALEKFVAKVTEFVWRGVNVLVIDLFPPTSRDPDGIHQAIWDGLQDDPFVLPPDKPLVLAAYQADPRTAYVEPVAVGDPLTPMPLFLDADVYVPAPLEETYNRTWEKCPAQFKELVLNPPAGG